MNQAIAFWNLTRRSRFLSVVTYVHLGALVFALAGLALDPRVITGAPAWLKPAKFAISTAVYAVTIAWLIGQITWRPHLARGLGNAIGAVLVIENVIIFAQAERGQASHFNVATALDATLFSIMGVAIACLFAASAVLSFTLFRSAFHEAAWGWALRWGMLISVLGSGMGGLMTQPTSAQTASWKAGNTPDRAGQHSVGGVDGGPGLPLVKWSTEHGDLRVAHFFGLHAIQVLPLAFWFLRRRNVVLIHTLAASYAGLVALLLFQALRGQPLLAPDSLTLGLLTTWAGLSLAAIGLTWSSANHFSQPSALQTKGRA